MRKIITAKDLADLESKLNEAYRDWEVITINHVSSYGFFFALLDNDPKPVVVNNYHNYSYASVPETKPNRPYYLADFTLNKGD